MTFNAQSGNLQITPEDARHGAAYFLCAIRNIKLQAGLPLAPYRQEGALSYADHAMHNILTGMERLGIDLNGARWGNEIDSTRHT